MAVRHTVREVEVDWTGLPDTICSLACESPEATKDLLLERLRGLENRVHEVQAESFVREDAYSGSEQTDYPLGAIAECGAGAVATPPEERK